MAVGGRGRLHIFKNNGRRWPLAVGRLPIDGHWPSGRGRGGRDGPAVTATNPNKTEFMVKVRKAIFYT